MSTNTDASRERAARARELDARVAVEVMGDPKPTEVPEDALERQLAGYSYTSPGGCWVNVSRYEDGDVPTWWPLPFSTQISSAWRVFTAPHLLAAEWLPWVESGIGLHGLEWEVGFGHNAYDAQVEFVKNADEVPAAICRAALAAAAVTPPRSAVPKSAARATGATP